MPRLQEVRALLRDEPAPAGSVLLGRGGPDTLDSLRADARRTARRFCLNSKPLPGISVTAAIDTSVDTLCAQPPLARFATVYTPTVADLRAFPLIPMFGRSHFIVCLWLADAAELTMLLTALGPLRANPRYA